MKWNLKVALKLKDLKHNSPGGTNQEKKMNMKAAAFELATGTTDKNLWTEQN